MLTVAWVLTVAIGVVLGWYVGWHDGRFERRTKLTYSMLDRLIKQLKQKEHSDGN